MAVAHDATGTEAVPTITASGSFTYTGLTVVSNSNGAIVIIIFTAKSVDTVSSVTGYNKISTATASDNTWHIEVWGKVGNSTGAQNIVINWSSGATTGDSANITAISVTGADQTGGSTTFSNNSNTGTSANATISIATSSTGLAIAGLSINNEATGTTHTNILADTGGTPSVFAGYDQNDASSPSVIATTGGVTSVVWAAAGCNISAPSAAFVPFQPYFQQLLAS